MMSVYDSSGSATWCCVPPMGHIWISRQCYVAVHGDGSVYDSRWCQCVFDV